MMGTTPAKPFSPKIKFRKMNGDSIDLTAKIKSIAEARKAIASALKQHPQCVTLVNAEGLIIDDTGPVPEEEAAELMVTVNIETSMYLGRFYTSQTPQEAHVDIQFDGDSQCLIAFKINGGPNVPSGEWSWRTDGPLPSDGESIGGHLQIRDSPSIPITIRAVSTDAIHLETTTQSPTRMQFTMMRWDTAERRAEHARRQEIQKHMDQLTPNFSEDTFGKELAMTIAQRLMEGRTASNPWVYWEMLPGLKTPFEVRHNWCLSCSPLRHEHRCFCLRYGRHSSTWHSIETFVDFFASLNDKTMAVLFFGNETKGTVVPCRVEGTLKKTTVLQQLV